MWGANNPQQVLIPSDRKLLSSFHRQPPSYLRSHVYLQDNLRPGSKPCIIRRLVLTVGNASASRKLAKSLVWRLGRKARPRRCSYSRAAATNIGHDKTVLRRAAAHEPTVSTRHSYRAKGAGP